MKSSTLMVVGVLAWPAFSACSSDEPAAPGNTGGAGGENDGGPPTSGGATQAGGSPGSGGRATGGEPNAGGQAGGGQSGNGGSAGSGEDGGAAGGGGASGAAGRDGGAQTGGAGSGGQPGDGGRGDGGNPDDGGQNFGGLPVDRSCAPATPDCEYGPKCGDECCGSGEWCDTRTTPPRCLCGAHFACSEGTFCETNLAQPNQCGDYCCVGMSCPISRRSAKREIREVSPEDLQQLYDELRKIHLSTYHYRDQPQGAPRRLGFIIDDTDAPAAIDPSGDRVDLYGYISMGVAAIQVQARTIAALEARLEALEKSCSSGSKREPAAETR